MGSRESRRAVLVTALLLCVVAALVWVGLRTEHLSVGADVATTEPVVEGSVAPTDPPTSPRAEPSSPTADPTRAVVAPEPELAAAFAAESAALDGQYALAWVDDAGIHVLGTAADDIAWSTIKVPLAVAALDAAEPGADVTAQVRAALTASDNDAAAALWGRLGPPEDAATAVDEVLDAYDSALTRTESEQVRPPFSAFGQTVWSVTDQARFAAAFGCTPAGSAAAEVRAIMAEVVPDQRWGIGRLEDAHFKGGWGPQIDGGYVARQLGDAEVNGQRYALAVSGRVDDGSFEGATAGLDHLVQWWADTVAPDSAGITCP
ncbi:MAG: hypothetical protein Q4G67_14635 [Actinomycetia bacterium]|nr:hypothetical protein [Actinomycetes bacterium]